MSSKDDRPARGPAMEGLSFRINEGGPTAPKLPYRLTWRGEGTRRVEGLGLFAPGTIAGVDRETALGHVDEEGWRVTDPEGRPVDRAELESGSE